MQSELILMLLQDDDATVSFSAILLAEYAHFWINAHTVNTLTTTYVHTTAWQSQCRERTPQILLYNARSPLASLEMCDKYHSVARSQLTEKKPVRSDHDKTIIGFRHASNCNLTEDNVELIVHSDEARRGRKVVYRTRICSLKSVRITSV